MDKLKHFFLHNTELLLYIACWAFHAFFSPLSSAYGYSVLSAYNVTVSFVYATFILLYKNLKIENLFFMFFYFESITYSIFLTVCTGADFGGCIFCANIIPLLFLTTLDKRFSKTFYLLHLGFALFALVFILWWSYARTGLLSLDFVTALTIHRQFYIAHFVVITGIMALLLFYYSILTEFTLHRSRAKANAQAEELDYKANHDPLTGLMNRRRFNQFLKRAQYEKETAGKDYSLTIFDIDGFKKINDTYGHDAGDFILQNMSAFVSRQLSQGQQFARWGGEEFVILFPETGEAVREELEKLRSLIQEQVFRWQYTDIHISLTFGLSSSAHSNDLEHLLVKADNRLMWGKQHGKNRVVTAREYEGI